MILTQLVSDHCRPHFDVAFFATLARFESIQVSGDLNAKPNCSDMELAKFWNDVPESMITLFLAITGGLSWDDAFRPLREVSVFAMSLLILTLGIKSAHLKRSCFKVYYCDCLRGLK